MTAAIPVTDSSRKSRPQFEYSYTYHVVNRKVLVKRRGFHVKLNAYAKNEENSAIIKAMVTLLFNVVR